MFQKKIKSFKQLSSNVSLENNESNLVFFSKLLINVEYFIFFGTLLGITRENRLIDWGGWFELKKNGREMWKREEKFKRCRIYLKYESKLDHIFTPNVQKSKSDIPHYLRHEIAEYCDQIRNDSSKIIRTRSNNEDGLKNKNIEESLVEKKDQNIQIKYEHPLIKDFLDKNLGKNRKEFLLDKLISDLKEEYKKDEGFFRKLFNG